MSKNRPPNLGIHTVLGNIEFWHVESLAVLFWNLVFITCILFSLHLVLVLAILDYQ